MKSITMTLLVATLFAVSACAPKMWTRPNTDANQFQKDRDHCQIVSSSAGSGNPLIINSEFNRCMKDRGYELGVSE